MSTAGRKQRQFQEREALILETARAMLLERGYLGITMDRIAEAIEYSKGTVYQHFANKEDLLAALVAETEAKRCALMEKALSFEGRPRERFMALGESYEIFIRRNPHHFRAEQIIRAASIREKVSPPRLAELKLQERRAFELGLGIVNEAISQGDLRLPAGLRPEDFLFGVWSLGLGSYTLLAWEGLFETFGEFHAGHIIGQNYNALLDGFGWRPLTDEWDYMKTYDRIYKEVFTEEGAPVHDQP